MTSLSERVSRELLPYVKQPGQYIGQELNQLVRPGDWQRADVRVAVCFPDAYTIGMSHLGCQILYWLCNHLPGVCAERVYAPWVDAEAVMRRRDIPLFTWDTRQPVREADILAISLQYELCFTTVLNLLDLAGIPLRAAEREDPNRRFPLVIVGGPQADNPEPMAEFVDLVVIGDGEHSMESLISAYRECQRQGATRRETVLELARRFPWVYAPNFYAPEYHSDGTLACLRPLESGLPARIERCKTPNFNSAPFPTRPLVPWVDVVHDRIAIEIMRGCPQVCRFCHAGYTKRPLQYRDVAQISAMAEEAFRVTGQKEIGLLSLSTADYPLLRELAARLTEQFAPRNVNLSFPSLRVDKMLANIPAMAASVRKSGLTIAVEAARDDMRRAIRKKVTDGRLLDGVRAAYEAGWSRLKLYFMAGFPGEREDDIQGIVELSRAVSAERQKLGKPPGLVTASVGWLVPKPFTPMQWMAQPRAEYFRAVRELLRGRISSLPGGRQAVLVSAGQGGYGAASGFRDPRGKGRGAVRIVTHDPERSILEGVFARGDRRLGKVIESAWLRGARFDGWDETFNNRIWLDAYAETGIDPDWYAHRERSFDELLPWDHIGLHMRRGYLQESYDDLFEKISMPKPSAGVSLPIALTPA